jgi:hypothetical protein
MSKANEEHDRDAIDGSQPSEALSVHVAQQDAAADMAAPAAVSAANAGGTNSVRLESADDLGSPQASPFAAAAATPAADPRQPAAALDIAAMQRLPLIAASRTATTGLHSDGSPATDTTMRAGASAPSPTGLHTDAEGSRLAATAHQAVHTGPTGPGAITPETSLSTGLGSNPSVRSDQTLPPAPSGELAAVFAFAEQSSSGHPAAAPHLLTPAVPGARSRSVPSAADRGDNAICDLRTEAVGCAQPMSAKRL